MKTRFARSDGTRIAYQVFGSGPLDLVFIPGFVSHVEMQWLDPLFERFLRRLGSFARVVIYDKRGVGRSDPVSSRPTVEQHVSDLQRVLGAVGSKSAVILGYSDGAPTALTYAAAFPHRVHGLVLVAPFASTGRHPDLIARADARCQPFLEHWGEGLTLDVIAPSLAGSRLNRSNFALFERACASPEGVRCIAGRPRDIDVSTVLPSISVPTLVLHRRDDFVPMELGRDIADGIPGARFVELTGGDHTPFSGDPTSVLVHIEEFVSEVAQTPMTQQEESMAVVFTDIVESSEHVVSLGDRRWRELVSAHDELTRVAAQQHGGEALESTGDGWLTVFPTAPAAVRFAWRVGSDMARVGLSVRAGVHAGLVQKNGGDVRGLTVHAAARLAAKATADEVLASTTVVGLCVDAGMTWATAGDVTLKGLPGTWTLHRPGMDAGADA